MQRLKMYQGGIYHICNKSIANFGIFQNEFDAQRFRETIDYYNNIRVWTSFSNVLKKGTYEYSNIIYPKNVGIIKILSYCIMPDHYHLLIKVLTDAKISKYLNDIGNSYSRFFNVKHHRKGPLWQSSYRIKRIETNEQLLHVSRYIHLNPTTSQLVENPEEWKFSSYKDIISDKNVLHQLNEISIQSTTSFKKFVDDNKDHQIKLKQIKRLLLD
ncbi:MAG: transposase [bacterium]|nr:transposase [bacterium]